MHVLLLSLTLKYDPTYVVHGWLFLFLSFPILTNDDTYESNCDLILMLTVSDTNEITIEMYRNVLSESLQFNQKKVVWLLLYPHRVVTLLVWKCLKNVLKT